MRSKSGTRAKRSEGDERTRRASSGEARENLLRPSWLRRVEARGSLPLPAASFSLFSVRTEDGVVDESSGVVHASLEASQARIKTQNAELPG